jgi:hypothetical protein
MTEGSEAKSVPHTFTNEERVRGQSIDGLSEMEHRVLLAWVAENLTKVRQSVHEQRTLRWSLGIGFVVGLAAHVGGYLLGSSTTAEPLGLLADLFYALGWSLWTGVVVVLFVQVIPEAMRRQYKQALDAYEAALGDGTRAGTGQPSGDQGAPTAG